MSTAIFESITKILSVAQVATKAGKSKQSVINWMEEGELTPDFASGDGDARRVFFRPSKIEKFLQKRDEKRRKASGNASRKASQSSQQPEHHP